MIEVFKTNVTQREHATMLLEHIHKTFAHYKANFDLDDCDHILRVKSHSGNVQPAGLIMLLSSFGFEAAVLPDDCPLSHL
ncbi:MAG TPA: hypothetical protein VD996_09270 [Chitinophagaceae bacterium]|nr:hypothetical protein [Chitinophagaceae bacterium]